MSGARVAALATLAVLVASGELRADHEPWTTTRFPQDTTQWWWDDAWWDAGRLDAAPTHPVRRTEVSYPSGDIEVPGYLFRPTTPGPHPGVLFQHGRRGLDDLTARLPLRLAARGFVVLAPDLWSARFIDPYPVAHDPALEADVARGIDFLLAQPGLGGKRVCVVSHTRGGYLTLKALVTHGRQTGQVACYVSTYPHWQDPNAAEPDQVYRYAPELEALEVPVLVMLGEHEQYQRLRPVLAGVERLQSRGVEARIIVYPGVGRGFDFRPRRVRTFADDLAARDALRRAERFIRRHLER